MATSADISDGHHGSAATGLQGTETRDAVRHPTLPRMTPSTRKEPTPTCPRCLGGERPLIELLRESQVPCLKIACHEKKKKKKPVLFCSQLLSWAICFLWRDKFQVATAEDVLGFQRVSRGPLQRPLPLDYSYWHFPRSYRISSPIFEAERGQPFGSFFC